jgi:hypothetical protein
MSTVYSVELGEFDHSAHVEDMEIACGECHTGPGGSVGVADLEYCSNCH